jgi:hypothetical protein
VREEHRVYFDRNATQSVSERRGSGGMHRRSNAPGLFSQAVQGAMKVSESLAVAVWRPALLAGCTIGLV